MLLIAVVGWSGLLLLGESPAGHCVVWHSSLPAWPLRANCLQERCQPKPQLGAPCAHRAATALEVYAVGGHVTGNFGSRWLESG